MHCEGKVPWPVMAMLREYFLGRCEMSLMEFEGWGMEVGDKRGTAEDLLHCGVHEDGLYGAVCAGTDECWT